MLNCFVSKVVFLAVILVSSLGNPLYGTMSSWYVDVVNNTGKNIKCSVYAEGIPPVPPCAKVLTVILDGGRHISLPGDACKDMQSFIYVNFSCEGDKTIITRSGQQLIIGD